MRTSGATRTRRTVLPKRRARCRCRPRRRQSRRALPAAPRRWLRSCTFASCRSRAGRPTAGCRGRHMCMRTLEHPVVLGPASACAAHLGDRAAWVAQEDGVQLREQRRQEAPDRRRRWPQQLDARVERRGQGGDDVGGGGRGQGEDVGGGGRGRCRTWAEEDTGGEGREPRAGLPSRAVARSLGRA